ncbi:MAG TPA: bifunctional DNA-formamidopyrimidine glycosylase/DNA-(apurinic or apyrimidinic site) lyase [Planctomycetota bacterium]|jgi:formamidopyrimidine-DNA glycosylase
MPELPEVETVVRALTQPLLGRRISRIEVLHRPSVAGSPWPLQKICGQRFQRLFRRGKFIRMDLDGGAGMAVHLRMTGWLGVTDAHAPADPHTRVRFLLDDGREVLVFRDIRTFGRIWCGRTGDLEALTALAKLGPEPLEIAADAFAERLLSRRGRLKSLLLNQEFLAGVGNIYADEALFAASLHPLGNALRLKVEQARKLHAAIQKILRAAIDAGGSSVVNYRRPDGERGWFQRELAVYGREGLPCVRCGAAIRRIVVGQRGTWFCPKCQKKR